MTSERIATFTYSLLGVLLAGVGALRALAWRANRVAHPAELSNAQIDQAIG